MPVPDRMRRDKAPQPKAMPPHGDQQRGARPAGATAPDQFLPRRYAGMPPHRGEPGDAAPVGGESRGSLPSRRLRLDGGALLRWSLVAGLCCCGVGWLLAHREAPPASGAAATAADANYFAFVPSMAGTRPDGALQADGARLKVTPELGYLFDYYLSGLGEKPLDAIRTGIVAELGRRLPPSQAAQAVHLLDAYLAYKRALADLERKLPATSDAVSGARQRLAAMQQLRASYFSADEIAGLFGANDAYDQDALARLAINSDKTLSATQRTQKLAALDAALSPQAREERAAPTRVLKLEEAVAQARAQGADDNEVYRMRAAELSSAAAARLADLDREVADWQRRIASYQAQRRQLLQNGAGDAALQQLRDAGFTPAEQKRLAAYE